MLFMIATGRDRENDSITSISLFDTITNETRWFPIENIKHGLKIGSKVENIELDSNGDIVGTNGAISRYTKVYNDKIENEALIVVGNIGKNKHMTVDMDGTYKLIFDGDKKEPPIANGKWVEGKLCSIKGEFNEFPTTIVDKSLGKMRLISSKYPNKRFRIDEHYNILLGTLKYNDGSTSDVVYKCSDFGERRTIDIMHSKYRNLSPDYCFKANGYREYISANKFCVKDKSVIILLKFESKTKKYYACVNGQLEKIGVDEVFVHKMSNNILLDAEIEELEDVWRVKTYFDEIYYTKEYVNTVLDRYKQANRLKTKSSLVGAGEYKIDAKGTLIEYLPSDTGCECVINSGINKIGVDAFYRAKRQRYRVDLRIDNEKVKFESVKTVGHIKILSAPDNILNKINNSSLSKYLEIESIRMTSRNTYEGYKSACGIVGRDNIIGNITEDIAHTIMQEESKDFVLKVCSARTTSTLIKILRREGDNLLDIANRVSKLGQKEIADSYLANTNNMKNITIDDKTIVYGNMLLLLKQSAGCDIRIPDEVEVISTDAINLACTINSIDFNNTKFIKERGVYISEINKIDFGKVEIIGSDGLRVDKLGEITGDENLRCLRSRIFGYSNVLNKLNHKENIEIIDMNSRVLTEDMINKDGTVYNKLLATINNEHIEVKIMSGDKVPQLILDNLGKFSIRDKVLGFNIIIKDVNSVISGALDELLRKAAKITLKNVKHVDFLMLSKVNTEFGYESDIEIVNDSYTSLYGSNYYSKRSILIDTKIKFISEDCELNADKIKLGKNVGEEDLKLLRGHMSDCKYITVSKDLLDKAKEIFNNSDKIQLLEE